MLSGRGDLYHQCLFAIRRVSTMLLNSRIFSLISSTRPAGPHRKWHYFPAEAAPSGHRIYPANTAPSTSRTLVREISPISSPSVLHSFVYSAKLKFNKTLSTMYIYFAKLIPTRQCTSFFLEVKIEHHDFYHIPITMFKRLIV